MMMKSSLKSFSVPLTMCMQNYIMIGFVESITNKTHFRIYNISLLPMLLPILLPVVTGIFLPVLPLTALV